MSTSSTRNFTTFEQQPMASVGTSAAHGSFSTAAGKAATSVKITNYGANGAQLIFDVAANPTVLATASAAGTKQIYIPAGAVEVQEKGQGAFFFSAITDTGTTNLVIEAGEGS